MTQEEFENLEGPERRKGYKELHKELEDHAAAIEARMRRFFSRALIAFAVLGISSAVGLAGFGVVLKKQGENSDEIQKQRFDSIVSSCTAQNKRHDRTIARIKQLTPKGAEDRIKSTIFIIDALQPKVADCEASARSRVKGGK